MTGGLQLSSMHTSECKPKGIVMVLLILILKCCICVGSGLNSEEEHCFCQYGDLQGYVVNNKVLMSNLTEAFFNTGAAETKFLKITYKYKLSTCNINGTHQNGTHPNGSAGEIEYIWSQSSLYLLGRKLCSGLPFLL